MSKLQDVKASNVEQGTEPPVFALIDCDSFFVSCERLFRPDLEGRPVVVLSSNDGCVISRSREATALGIPMAGPAFKHRDVFERHGVVQFSANFELYGDISERIIRVLTSITPRTEVYSVDESFLDLSELQITDYSSWGRMVHRRLLKEVGIPVSMGVAPTKTLAKLAREYAKTDPAYGSVLDLYSLPPAARLPYLQNLPINAVWGIGWRLAPKLRAEGIYNALDLSGMRPQLAQQLMGVHGRQLVRELNGQVCLGLTDFGRVRQSIMHGRMFGEDTSQFSVIEAAIASLTARAAFGLRREGLVAQTAVVSLSTNRNKPGYQRQDHLLRLTTPSADTGSITAELIAQVAAGFNPRMRYHRANVLLYNLLDECAVQPDLFGAVDLAGNERAHARLQALDSLNARYGKRTVRYAAEDLSNRWEPKHQLRSPRYTTHWQELPTARILDPGSPDNRG